MKLRIECSHAHTPASEFPELATLTDQLPFGAHAEVRLQQLAPGVLERLSQLRLDGSASQQRRAAQLDALRQVLRDDILHASAGDGYIHHMETWGAQVLLTGETDPEKDIGWRSAGRHPTPGNGNRSSKLVTRLLGLQPSSNMLR